MSKRIMIFHRIAYFIILAFFSLNLSLPIIAKSALSEKEIDEIISSLGETDEKLINELRDRFRKIRSEEDIKEMINKKKESGDIENLAKTLGFHEVQKIAVGTTHPGYSVFIKVFDKREWVNATRYKQNILYVAIKNITNSTLLLGTSNSISTGNFYSNLDNITNYTYCQVKHKGLELNITVDDKVTCQEITEIINLFENGNITISSDLKAQPTTINWREVGHVSKNSTGFEISTNDTRTSGKIFLIEKIDDKLILKDIYNVQS